MNQPIEALTYDRDEAYARRCKAYRERHGELALGVYSSSQELFVVKSNAGEVVTLISVQTKSERSCPKADFQKTFIFALWVWDEMVYYTGNQGQKAAQSKLVASVNETIEACFAADEAATP